MDKHPKPLTHGTSTDSLPRQVNTCDIIFLNLDLRIVGKIQALMDTGSGISCIDKSLVSKDAELEPLAMRNSLSSYHGNHVTGYITTLVDFGGQWLPKRLFIIAMKKHPEFIIGTDWTLQNDFCHAFRHKGKMPVIGQVGQRQRRSVYYTNVISYLLRVKDENLVKENLYV